MFELKDNIRTLRSSSDQTLLKTPFYKRKSFGGRAFSIFGAEMWNKVPKYIREKEDLRNFKKELKHTCFLIHIVKFW